MADKFISASKLLELLGIDPDCDCDNCSHRGRFGCRLYDIQFPCKVINDCPDAGVWPVIHSAWVVTEDLFGETCHCLECGFSMSVNEPGNGLPMVENLHFCPNCGAYMGNSGVLKE